MCNTLRLISDNIRCSLYSYNTTCVDGAVEEPTCWVLDNPRFNRTLRLTFTTTGTDLQMTSR